MANCFFWWSAGCTYDAGATAAWAQAVLSAGAVFIAWWLQSKSNEARDDEALRTRLRGVAAVVKIATDLIREAEADLGAKDNAVRYAFVTRDGVRQSFERTEVLLDRVPIHEQPSGDLALCIHNLREAVGSTGRKVIDARPHYTAGRVVADVDLSFELGVVREVEAVFNEAWAQARGAFAAHRAAPVE